MCPDPRRSKDASALGSMGTTGIFIGTLDSQQETEVEEKSEFVPKNLETIEMQECDITAGSIAESSNAVCASRTVEERV